MNHIFELRRRANIEVLKYYDKYVVIYEDHRFLLNVLYFLHSKENISEPLNLFYFDYHDDAIEPHQSIKDIAIKFRNQLPTMPDFWTFTEFNIGSLDDDWLLTGMELNFIKDAILIGAEKDNNLKKHKGIYNDQTGATHRLYSIPHLWESLDRNGCLGEEASITEEYKNIREILEFNTPQCPLTFTSKPNNGYILDFDCDVFSLDILGKRSAWPFTRMKELFFKDFMNFNTTPYDMVRQLIDRATIITICRETPYCGGIMQASNIFHNMDQLFFDGQLSL